MKSFFPLLRQKIKKISARLSPTNKYQPVLQQLMKESLANPDDMRLRIQIAETYFKCRDIPKAIETYQEVVSNYLKHNFIMKAVQVYKSILVLDPSQIEVNLKLSELYLKLGMVPDAVNQYRIAIQAYTSSGDKEKTLEVAKKLLDVDPSPANRRRLAEIYQSQGLLKESVQEYNRLAQEYRTAKNYEALLRIYELLIPHQKDNRAMIRDVCILYLRRSEPDHAIRIMERYKLDTDPTFLTLYDKAKMMKKALRSGGNIPPLSSAQAGSKFN